VLSEIKSVLLDGTVTIFLLKLNVQYFSLQPAVKYFCKRDEVSPSRQTTPKMHQHCCCDRRKYYLAREMASTFNNRSEDFAEKRCLFHSSGSQELLFKIWEQNENTLFVVLIKQR
jgi:hypothetical protein